jgi:hypothetical protein
MNSPRNKQDVDLRRYMRVPLHLVLLCIAVGIVAAFPASVPAAPPANDDFANAQDLGSESSASASGTNVDATAEPGEPDHAGIPARASVWYRWTAPENGQVRIETCDSDFDTVLAVYTGSAVDALTPVASNDDTCGLQSRVQFNAVIFQEARRHAALVADAYPAFKQGGQAFMADYIHPNDAGHAAIADAFREASVPCRTEGPPDGSPPPDGTEPDTLAPTTVITKGPKGKTKRRKAAFRFRATEPSTFQCSLAGKKVKRKLRRWRRCGPAQPARGGRQRYRKLRPGKKVFRVRAIDRAGNVGKPAVRKWRVMRRRR